VKAGEHDLLLRLVARVGHGSTTGLVAETATVLHEIPAFRFEDAAKKTDYIDELGVYYDLCIV